MDAKLFCQALTKFLLGVVIFGLLIFLPAGSFHYWQGWLMMAILFGLILFLAMPLVLASPISFLIMLFYIPLIAKRIRNEETVLEQGLEGYVEYKKREKYKVIPYIW